MSVAAVEIEVSLQAYERETKDGGYWNLLNFPSVPGKLIHIPA
jgi:hypothetical protein